MTSNYILARGQMLTSNTGESASHFQPLDRRRFIGGTTEMVPVLGERLVFKGPEGRTIHVGLEAMLTTKVTDYDRTAWKAIVTLQTDEGAVSRLRTKQGTFLQNRSRFRHHRLDEDDDEDAW